MANLAPVVGKPCYTMSGKFTYTIDECSQKWRRKCQKSLWHEPQEL